MTEPKFMTPAHRRAYLTHLNRCKAMDSYHRALIYTLTAVPALRNNIESCFGFETRRNQAPNHWLPVGRPPAQRN